MEISPEVLEAATPAELQRLQLLLKKEFALESPMNMATLLFPETQRWTHLEYLSEHLKALFEYRLCADGPIPAAAVQWYYIPEGDTDQTRIQVPGPHDIPRRVDAYGAYDSRPDRGPEHAVVFRLAVSMHPRAGKSRLVNEVLPFWVLLQDPHTKVAVGTYSDDFARDWGVQNRRTVMDRHDEMPFLPQPEGGLKSAANFFVVEGIKSPGSIRYAGTGGGVTGKGFNVMIGDDFIKNEEEASSAANLKAAADFYDTTWESRKTRDYRPEARFPIPIEILQGTRWNAKDVHGHACYDSETRRPHADWCIINLPALAGPDDPLGREEGAALVPEVKTRQELELLRVRSPRTFACLYQGRPTSASTNLFQGEPATYDELNPPDFSEAIHFAAADMAATKSTRADFTVVGVFAYVRAEDKLYLRHMYRQKITTDQYLSEITPVLDRFKIRKVTMENITYGQVFGQQLQRAGYVPDYADKRQDKVARVLSSEVTDRWRDGRLLVNKHLSQLDELVQEATDFPTGGEHDDMVDMLAFGGLFIQDYRPRKAVETKPIPTEVELIDAHVDQLAKKTRHRKNRRTGHVRDLYGAI